MTAPGQWLRDPPLRVGAVLLLLLLIMAYEPAWTAGFVWDDNEHLVDNATVQSPDGLRLIWTTVGTTPQFYPLTFTAFWLQHKLWGLDPRGYHAVNVVLMWIVTVLLWRLFRKLGSPVAWWGACLFAVHPVNVMSVAWVTELKNVLAGCFLAGAALVYAKATAGGNTLPSRRTLAGVFALYFLAMTAKTAASFLPFSLLLLCYWRGRRPAAREWTLFVAMLLVAAVFSVITIRWETMTKFAVLDDFSLTWLQRWIVFGTTFWFYLSKAVMPADLCFFYPRWEILDPPAAWQHVFPMAAVAAIAMLYIMRHRIGRAPFATVLHYTLTTSALILVHVLYMTRYTWVADHWQFFGLLGLVPAAAWTIDAVLSSRGATSTVRSAAFAAIACIFVIASRTECRSYADIDTFYRTILARNPSSWLAHNNLGYRMQQQGRLAEAEQHYNSSLSLRPDNAEAINNLGSLLFETGRPREAEAHFREAIRLQPQLPGIYNNLGRILAMQDRTDEAASMYATSLERNPDDAVALTGLGLARARQERFEEALALFRRALAGRPRDPLIHQYAAMALEQQGDDAGAVRHYLESLRLDPSRPDPANAAAWVLSTSPDDSVRDGTAALRLAERAVAARPSDPRFLGTLAAALAESGDFAGAVAAADRALAAAGKQGDGTFARETRERRTLYGSGKAFREDRNGK